MKRRAPFIAIAALIGLMLYAAPSARIDAATPTPTPTPAPAHSPSNNFQIDANAALPWPLPSTPVLPTVVTPQPTLYNATPAHSTDFPNTLGTATAQIASFNAPIDAVLTPAAGVLGLQPTASGGDISLGVQFTGGPDTLLAVINDFSDRADEALIQMRSYSQALSSLASYVPAVGLVVGVSLLAISITWFTRMLSFTLNILVAIWNILVKILDTTGIWIRG